MLIRPALPDDAGAIWSILRPVFAEGETYCLPRDIDEGDALAYWGGGGHRVFVAVANEVARGTYFLRPNQQGGGAHVANAGFATAASAQGEGVGRAMLDHALGEARAAGFRAMQFNFVVGTNAHAIALWRAAGFETVGRISDAFDHPIEGLVDALVMWRRL